VGADDLLITASASGTVRRAVRDGMGGLVVPAEDGFSLVGRMKEPADESLRGVMGRMSFRIVGQRVRRMTKRMRSRQQF